MRFHYLLWDMDGTLFDTYPPLGQAAVDTFAVYGVTVSAAEVLDLMTVTLGHCIETLALRHGLDPVELMAAYLDRAARVSVATQPPFPGVEHVLRRVVAAGGGNFIFTHRGRESLDGFLTHFGLADLFADTLTQDEGYARKPDPAGFLALIERNGLPRAEVLTVGDRDLDILAGINAGIHTCLYAAQPSPDAPPDFVIQDYAELEALLFEG